MPFPSPQGTQAIVRMMLNALGKHGHDAHLLTYAHGFGNTEESRFTHHRIVDWPVERSLRSGMSWKKLFLDVQLVEKVRRLARRL